MCVCVCVCACVRVLCCGMVWVSNGWGLGGVVLRKGSLSSGCLCVCGCVCVCAC